MASAARSIVPGEVAASSILFVALEFFVARSAKSV